MEKPKKIEEKDEKNKNNIAEKMKTKTKKHCRKDEKTTKKANIYE